MARRTLSVEDVMTLLLPEEEYQEQGVDDPHECLAEGSDEEFDDLEELTQGMVDCDLSSSSVYDRDPPSPANRDLPSPATMATHELPLSPGEWSRMDISPVSPIQEVPSSPLAHLDSDPPQALATSSLSATSSSAIPPSYSLPTSTSHLPPHQSSNSQFQPHPSASQPSASQPSTQNILPSTSSVDTAWSDTLRAPVIHPFIPTSPIGPAVQIPDTPLEIFRLFYTAELISMIVDQTNLYAEEVMGSEKYSEWTKVTSEEIEAFLGFNFLMGLNPKPSVSDYWSKNPVYHYAPIASRISRDRYREISRYLHFVDNSTLSPPGTPSYDRLGKVRPLLDYLQQRFSSLYNPGREIAVDEAMIKFQGRSSLKQYMPKKPIKRGIKVWVLGDSSNGYFSRLEVYTGRKGDSVEQGLGSRVVKDLTKDFQQRWHRAFFDNFFTSKSLLCDLESVGVYGCGTARSDRKLFPQKLKKPKLKNRGESLTVQADNVAASAWMDRKLVTIMYTGFNPMEETTVLRRQKDGTRSQFTCPIACAEYNKHMGGVDRGDQLRGYYAYKLKSRKFYKYIANFLGGVSLTNAFILFKLTHPTTKTNIKKFQEVLAIQLIGEYSSRRRAGRISHREVRLPLRHFPATVTGPNGKKRGRCKRCQERGHRRDTQWYCAECEAWLCHPGTAGDCFLLWHRSRI